ncbi:MAG: hypothetical protein AAF907_10340, partial [Planctomycetota bacterium]
RPNLNRSGSDAVPQSRLTPGFPSLSVGLFASIVQLAAALLAGAGVWFLAVRLLFKDHDELHQAAGGEEAGEPDWLIGSWWPIDIAAALAASALNAIGRGRSGWLQAIKLSFVVFVALIAGVAGWFGTATMLG